MSNRRKRRPAVRKPVPRPTPADLDSIREQVMRELREARICQCPRQVGPHHETDQCRQDALHLTELGKELELRRQQRAARPGPDDDYDSPGGAPVRDLEDGDDG